MSDRMPAWTRGDEFEAARREALEAVHRQDSTRSAMPASGR